MSEQLYVAIDYRDPHGRDHVRGDQVSADMADPLVKELLFRGILSAVAPHREAGTNSARVSVEGSGT